MKKAWFCDHLGIIHGPYVSLAEADTACEIFIQDLPEDISGISVFWGEENQTGKEAYDKFLEQWACYRGE